MKLNMTHSWSHIWGASRRVEVFSNGRDATPGSRLRSSYYYGHRGCEVLDISQTDIEYVVDFSCELTYTKTRSAINGGWFTQVYNYNGNFELSKERYDLCSYDEQFCNNIPLNPVNLTQEVQSPNPWGEDFSRDTIEIGGSVGKFQSGSGIILWASTLDEAPESLFLHIDVYNTWETTPIFSNTTLFNASWSGEIIVPNLSAGEYYWTAQVVSSDGYESETEQFANNTMFDTDFALFEWFEPYPYGYSFKNSIPNVNILTWWVSWLFNKKIVYGTKWEIFDTIYNPQIFSSEKERIYSFESQGLNEDNPSIWSWGSCYGMALTSALYKKNPDALEEFSPWFYSDINGNIWKNISIETNNKWEWISSNGELTNSIKAIFVFQLLQRLPLHKELRKQSIQNQTPQEILDIIKRNPDKQYIITFAWKKGLLSKKFSHAVVPYKVEWNRVYVWDNNIPYPGIQKSKSYRAYEQYIDITWSEKKDFTSDYYATEKWWNYFSDFALIDVTDLLTQSTTKPLWFNEADSLYTLSWKSNFLIVDSQGRRTGFEWDLVFEEIPWSSVIIPIWVTWESNENENTWKQIYIPEKQEDITIKVWGVITESYDILFAWGNYYTKIEDVETFLGSEDIFRISSDSIEIDYDDWKEGDYNILIENFEKTDSPTIFRWSLAYFENLQRYSIDWDIAESLKYEQDGNGDGMLDRESYFSVMPSSENELWSISGYVISTPTNAGYKICLDKNKNSICEENIEKFMVTDNSGYYEFKDLKEWKYNIIQEKRKNWNIINPDSQKYELYLNNGQNYKNINFQNEKIKWKK